ncbi:MAG: 50S ribosomal protein L20 [Candidatus Vogelbacteria bacterium]|nr:50S ribosomal protein L20 [Candidatus Vogelbacteria bacterium]
MTRVKRGTTSNKTRKNTLSKTKGYRFGRSTKEREAKVAIAKAGVHAFAHRRDKKNDFRRLWNVRIGAGLKEHGLSYSKFIGALKKANIELDRKVLSELAKDNPAVFAKVVAAVK